VAFEVDDAALDAAGSTFSDRLRAARRRAAVMDRVLDGLGDGGGG
jgi:hypothetical protein